METRNCQNCKKDFTIESNDFGFYEKLKVPPPTFCPDCRRQRRWAWRNNMSLYSSKCELCGKSVVSLYAPDSGITVYCNKCWWSDKWDPKSYGTDYDFSRPFFEQFNELMHKVPHMATVNDDGIASLNCEYTHDWWFSKNCYMCFSGWYVENVMYSFFILAGRDLMDSMNIRTKSEWLYECINCGLSYQLKNSQLCKACIDSSFLYNCINCTDCFMCACLKNKKYCYRNKQYSKEEYEEILKSYKLDTFSGVEKAQEEYNNFITKFPRRFAHLNQCVNCIGELISTSKNTKNSFLVKHMENCSYCDYAGDSKNPAKDCYDITLTAGVSECYECVVGDHSQLNLFALYSVKSQDIKYTQHCHNCKYSFGCIGLRNDKYCILNKQYTKEEYEKLVPKIIEQMNKVPYVDKIGNEYRFGEFYPIELSPFGYNETYALELEPLTEKEAQSKGYNWQENVQRTKGKETLLPENIPESINDVPDSIINEVMKCIECERNYKIISNELIFYKKLGIPIPRRCLYCRYAQRIKKRNPLKLWRRRCMCEENNHKDHEAGSRCEIEFETTYAPERPEIVYCERCYQDEMQ